jgi:hypothetical protein
MSEGENHFGNLLFLLFLFFSEMSLVYAFALFESCFLLEDSRFLCSELLHIRYSTVIHSLSDF